jgi:hypothetical protein
VRALFVRALGVRGRLGRTHVSVDEAKTLCGLPVQSTLGPIPSLAEADRRLDCVRCGVALSKAASK